MSKPTVGFGILSWKGYDSLNHSLQTYADQNLFHYFDEQLVFLPQIEEAGIAIARKFNLPYAGHPQNIGIMGGFQAMAQHMKSDYVLLIENDCPLIENEISVKVQLARALGCLEKGEAHVWRFRHRFQPGEKWQIWKTENYWPRPDEPWQKRAMGALRRFLRPAKALRLMGQTVYTHDNAALRFPKYIQRTAGGDFIVDSATFNWSNNTFFISRRFFLDVIIPAVLANPCSRLVNGFPTMENELNGLWWRNQHFKIGISNPGLFTHARQGDRGY